MSRLLIPRTTQVPNILLDTVIPKLPPGAVRVLLAVVRKTYGFQKFSDRISISQLQTLTGLSRQGVIKGTKDLGTVLKTKLGSKGKGANEYSLNLDISTGQLVNKVDQSNNLTSQLRVQRVVKKVDPPKPSIQNQDRGPESPSPKNSDSRVREFFAFWKEEYQKQFGEPYFFNGGKEGKLIKDYLLQFDLPKLQKLALRFFGSKDSWVQEHGGYTIGVFASQINKLISTAKTIENRSQRNVMPL